MHGCLEITDLFLVLNMIFLTRSIPCSTLKINFPCILSFNLAEGDTTCMEAYVVYIALKYARYETIGKVTLQNPSL